MTTTFKPAGSRAGNQYGKTQVRYASTRQQEFIARLLTERNHQLGDIDPATVSLKEASAVIDALLSSPKKLSAIPVMSEKQVGFIGSLAIAREGGEELVAMYLEDNFVSEIGLLNKEIGSKLIELLQERPVKPLDFTLEVGAYVLDGEFYSVRFGRESGKPYALKWFDTIEEWVYQSGIVNRLRPEFRLTLEQARSFGVATGQCIHCGRALKDAKAIAQGIGSTCKKKYLDSITN